MHEGLSHYGQLEARLGEFPRVLSECYHCPSSQYTKMYAFVRAEERLSREITDDFRALTAEWITRANRLGYPVVNPTKATGRLDSGGWAYRSPIGRRYLTATEDGQPVAPLTGAYSEYDGGHTGLIFNYLSGMAVTQ